MHKHMCIFRVFLISLFLSLSIYIHQYIYIIEFYVYNFISYHLPIYISINHHRVAPLDDSWVNIFPFFSPGGAIPEP